MMMMMMTKKTKTWWLALALVTLLALSSLAFVASEDIDDELLDDDMDMEEEEDDMFLNDPFEDDEHDEVPPEPNQQTDAAEVDHDQDQDQETDADLPEEDLLYDDDEFEGLDAHAGAAGAAAGARGRGGARGGGARGARRGGRGARRGGVASPLDVGSRTTKSSHNKAAKDAAANPSASASASAAADGGMLGGGAAPQRSRFSWRNLASIDWSQYQWEAVALCFLVVYIINYFIGSRKNDAIAQAFFNEFQPIFDEQFARLGAYAGDQEGMILKDSASCYKFYASGRRHCQGILVTLTLIERHDLFSLAASLLDMATTRDSVTIQLPLDDEAMPNIVFAVMPQKHVKRMRRTLPDLEDLAGLGKNRRLDDYLAVMCDVPELAQSLIDEKEARVLNENKKMVGLIHFSDDVALKFSKARKVLTFTYMLDTPYSDMYELMQLAIRYVDRVALLQLSAAGQAASQKCRETRLARNRKAEHEKREERIARLREEKIKQEEERVKKMTPKQRAAHEAQKAKRELKKRKKARVKMIR